MDASPLSDGDDVGPGLGGPEPNSAEIDARHRSVVAEAWLAYDDGRKIVSVDELSAMVSTNRVFRLHFDDGTRAIAKSSNYGSFFLFAEDHDRLHRVADLLNGGRFDHFMARSLIKNGEPFIWYDGEMWAVFYEELELKERLPSILADEQVAQLGREMAAFHKHCHSIARLLPAPSKTAKSDMINLHESLGGRYAAQRFGLEESRIDLVRRHTHRFLMATTDTGYDFWAKIPVLIDWNLGNFSVDFDVADAPFHLFSRWDYDWFRIESRLMDFYFLSRVSSRTGDRSTFTYSAHTLLEPRFRVFLRAYHEVFPLTADEVLFLAEAYRFFLLNYVVREGRFFFRYDFWQHLLHDAVDVHLPALDHLDLSPLVKELGL